MRDHVADMERRANLMAKLFAVWPKEWPALDVERADIILRLLEWEVLRQQVRKEMAACTVGNSGGRPDQELVRPARESGGR